MLKNASFLAVVAVHTAENEPSKVGPACLPDPPGSNKQLWERAAAATTTAAAAPETENPPREFILARGKSDPPKEANE